MSKDYYYDTYRLAEFYDDMYTYQDDFELWSKIIKNGDKILEVACGTGRLTEVLLNNYKYLNVDALDYSEEMLEKLRKKVNRLDLNHNKLNIIKQDMREITFNEKYDVILIPSNSLNHIEVNEDLVKTLKGLYQALKPGGYLAFDILNPRFEFLLRNPNLEYNGKIYVQRSTGKKFYNLESNKYDYASQINHVIYTYYFCDDDGNRIDDKIYRMNINVRLFYPQEMDLYLSQLPFRDMKKYDWYDERAFTGNSSEQIYVLKK